MRGAGDAGARVRGLDGGACADAWLGRGSGDAAARVGLRARPARWRTSTPAAASRAAAAPARTPAPRGCRRTTSRCSRRPSSRARCSRSSRPAPSPRVEQLRLRPGPAQVPGRDEADVEARAAQHVTREREPAPGRTGVSVEPRQLGVARARWDAGDRRPPDPVDRRDVDDRRSPAAGWKEQPPSDVGPPVGADRRGRQRRGAQARVALVVRVGAIADLVGPGPRRRRRSAPPKSRPRRSRRPALAPLGSTSGCTPGAKAPPDRAASRGGRRRDRPPPRSPAVGRGLRDDLLAVGVALAQVAVAEERALPASCRKRSTPCPGRMSVAGLAVRHRVAPVHAVARATDRQGRAGAAEDERHASHSPCFRS